MFKSNFQVFIENSVLTLLTCLKIILKSKWSGKVKGFGDESVPCTILTNGPSLQEVLKSIKAHIYDHDIVCVNHFPVSDLYEELKPKYYVTTAPDLWLEDIEPRFIEQSNTLFETMSNKTTWSLKLLIPHEAKKYKRWQKWLENHECIEIVYFNNTPIEGFQWFRRFCFDQQLGMPRPHNVLIPCLTLSLCSGYRQIEVLGADHSWLPEVSVTQDNTVLIRQKHFYDEGTAKALPQDKKGKGQRKLHELLEKYLHTFRGYFILREYSDDKGAEIVNLTEESFIDAFQKMTVEEYHQNKNAQLAH